MLTDSAPKRQNPAVETKSESFAVLFLLFERIADTLKSPKWNINQQNK